MENTIRVGAQRRMPLAFGAALVAGLSEMMTPITVTEDVSTKAKNILPSVELARAHGWAYPFWRLRRYATRKGWMKRS